MNELLHWLDLDRRPDEPALYVGPGRRLSRRQLRERSRALAASLTAFDLAVGARVGICDSDDETFFCGLLACWYAGCVAVPLNTTAPPEIQAAIRDKARLSAIIDATGEPSLQEGAVEDLDATTPDTAAVLFTSGSSGTPKGVMLSAHSLAANAAAMGAVLRLGAADRLLTNIPFTFTSAIAHFLTAVGTGACHVAVNQFAFGRELIALIAEHEATGFGGAPVQLARMADTLGDGTAAPESLRFVMSSGDHLAPETIHAWKSAAPGVAVYTVYGLTELGGRFCVLDDRDLPQCAGSVGRPIKGLQLRILDDDGRDISASGEAGVVYASGALVMQGYLHDAESTASTLGPKGLCTGDVGRLDTAGYLYLEGRNDEVFKVSGEKVSCQRVREVIMDTGLLDDVAVLPMQHPMAGKVPAALYVVAGEVEPDMLKTLKRDIAQRLGTAAVPRKFVRVEQIPRTGSGKLDRPVARGLVDA